MSKHRVLSAERKNGADITDPANLLKDAIERFELNEHSYKKESLPAFYVAKGTLHILQAMHSRRKKQDYKHAIELYKKASYNTQDKWAANFTEKLESVHYYNELGEELDSFFNDLGSSSELYTFAKKHHFYRTAVEDAGVDFSFFEPKPHLPATMTISG